MTRRLLVVALSAFMMVVSVGSVAVAGGEKDIEWCFEFTDGFNECGTATTNDTQINGMTVHVSCSAVFDENGFSNKGQPVAGSGDPAIMNYEITHYTINKQGERVVKKHCGETFIEEEPPAEEPPAEEPPAEEPPAEEPPAEEPPAEEPPAEEPPGQEPPAEEPPAVQPAVVLGDEITPQVAPETLPRTGVSNTTVLLIAALSLIGAGFSFGLPTQLAAALKRS